MKPPHSAASASKLPGKDGPKPSGTPRTDKHGTAPGGGKPSASAKGGASGQATATAHAARVPDAHGYVFINGRRVRMISTKGLTTAKKPKRDASSSPPEARDADAPPASAKTKLSDVELEHYRELLLTKRSELAGDLSAMEAQALKSNGGDLSHMPIHMADIGTDTYDQDFMLSLAENERQQLREIDAALQRIADGSYAVCQLTGKPIPKTRLNAKPWARYTIEAAREFEQGRGV